MQSGPNENQLASGVQQKNRYNRAWCRAVYKPVSRLRTGVKAATEVVQSGIFQICNIARGLIKLMAEPIESTEPLTLAHSGYELCGYSWLVRRGIELDMSSFS